ncbi:uncharacterized protein [Salvelinus sp. IW2-2015]|uniref:uncharacterized protein n=1 Tax=Salvelinus sp. IW2-2015 TaxID=2691554 RepID=UPI0038D3AB09
MIVDFRKAQREHPPILINRTAVEKVESFKFLSVHITDKLKWSTHTDSVVKKAQQHLFNLRRLKKFVFTPKPSQTFTDAQLRATCQSVSTPETQTENDAGFSVIPTVSDATPTPDSYLSSESPSEGYETEAESGSGFSTGVNSEGEDQLKSSEAPLEDSLSLTFVLVPVVLVVVIIAMVVGVVIINRRWNRKEKSNSDHVEEDKYLHGSDDTENVPMPMFEDDVPSVLELEMEDLEQWMNKDGGVRMDSGQGI